MTKNGDGKIINHTSQWEAGDYDFYFERRIVSIEDNRVTLDAPVVQSMEKRFTA